MSSVEIFLVIRWKNSKELHFNLLCIRRKEIKRMKWKSVWLLASNSKSYSSSLLSFGISTLSKTLLK